MTTFEMHEIRLVQQEEIKALRDKVKELEREITRLQGRLVFNEVADWSVVKFPDPLL